MKMNENIKKHEMPTLKRKKLKNQNAKDKPN